MHYEAETGKQPRIRLSKVLLNLILSAAIIFGSMPCTPFVMEVKADTQSEKTITGLGLGTIDTLPTSPLNPEAAWDGDYVYFGKYDGKPMKYRVLSCQDRALLDCDNVLKKIPFSTSNNTSWEDSEIRKWLQGDEFYNNTAVFTVAEKNAIIADPCDDIEGVSSEGNTPSGYEDVKLSNPDPVFVLNVSAVTNDNWLGYYDGIEESETRKKTYLDGNKAQWWLRSTSSLSKYVGGVKWDGQVDALSIDDAYAGVSPALYLDTDPILYSSLINVNDGAKGYKLTITDGDLSVSCNSVEKEDDRVTVSYTYTDNSESADPTQISVVVTDKEWEYTNKFKNNNIKLIQYTKLAMDSFGSSGTGTFTLNSNATGTWGEDYHVYILAEDVNGTCETDYASEPLELGIKSVQASAEDVEVTYDGKPHGISVNIAGDTEGVTVKYGSSADDCTKELGDLAITNVSDSPREIFYKASKQGYRSASGSATVTIKKAPLKVSPSGQIPYGSPLPKDFELVCDGLADNDNSSVLKGTESLKFECDYVPGNDIGSYPVRMTGELTADNYDINLADGVLEVVRAPHPDVNVSGNAAYGTEGILELKEGIEAGGTLGEVSIEGEEAILDGRPVTDGTRLRFKFKNNPENVGKKAKVTVSVNGAKNYLDYTINAELEVISCDHSNKKLVEGTSIPATCTDKGYEGDYRCPDCGAVIPGKNTPIDPENHDPDKEHGSVTKDPTPFTMGEHTYPCKRCGKGVILADIPCVEEKGRDYSDLIEDTKDESGNTVISANIISNEKGEEVTVVSVNGIQVEETVKDPESGKETTVSKVWIAGLEKAYTYTGSAIKPQIRVYDGTRKLTEKTDYTLSYKNNKEVGTKAEIIVKFKGSYSSSEATTAGFEIVKAELGKDILARDAGTADEKKVKKTLPSLVWAETGKGVNSKFFDFEYGEVSGNECKVTIRPKANYTGTYDKETRAKVRIVSDQNLLISKAKVTFNPKSYAYTGAEITPSYKVTIGNATLEKDVDFTETIQNGIYPGTATLLIEAKAGNSKGYAGSRTATFKITGTRAINDNPDITFDVSKSVPFAKGGAKAALVVKDGETVLKEGVDYTLSYSKNKAVTSGETAEVKIKGRGNYKGNVTEKFAIVKQQLSALSENIIIEDQFTAKDKLKKPSVTITDLDGKKLSASKDYEIEKIDKDDPANTPESGTVRVTIKGKDSGAYEGRVVKTFRYMKAEANVGKAGVSKKIPDQTYYGYEVVLSNEDLTGVLTLNGKTLVPGKDFKVTGYSSNSKKGSAKVTVRGLGDYAGTKTISFRILQKKVDYKGSLT